MSALETFVERVKTALEPNKNLSTHKLAFDFCVILLNKFELQKNNSKILSNHLLKVSQLLDPQFVRKVSVNEENAVSIMSDEYLRLFDNVPVQSNNSTQPKTSQNVESNDLMDIFSSNIHEEANSSTESISDENSIECKIKVKNFNYSKILIILF